MKKNEKAPGVGAPETQGVMPKINIAHSYYITLVMAVTTAIAGMNIKDLWSGIVTMLCALVTIWLVYETVGGFEDDGV